MSDSVYTLPAIVVRAQRPSAQETLDLLPGSVSVVEMAPLQERLVTAAEVLNDLPGLHVNNYSSFGAFSTVSIRGCGSNQVSIYLDGVPLVRAGLGVSNLAELPIAGIERIEVYRSFAPADFPGASVGGVVNLVTRPAAPAGESGRSSALVGSAGSLDTRRFGTTQQITIGPWSGLLIADVMRTRGDFLFYNDSCTTYEPRDDEVTTRINNWLRSGEVLTKLGRSVGRGELRLVNQWMRRQQGAPGIYCSQAEHTRLGTTYNVTTAELHLPPLLQSRLQSQVRVFHEWRRDTFLDIGFPSGEIGLGYQDNRDVTRTLGTHFGVRGVLPVLQHLALDIEARDEWLLPWRGYPLSKKGPGPRQERRSLEIGLEERLQLVSRLELHAGMRVSHRRDDFEGDLRNSYSQRPARSGTHAYREPRLGARLRLATGVWLKTTYGRYHRTPSFLELFGDAGSVAGSSDLIAEEGTNRDYGLLFEGTALGLRARLEAAHFDNDVEHLITFVPQSQRVFVARNIGSAWMRGMEWSWRIASHGPKPLWSAEGNFTHLRAKDRGVDGPVYAGKSLPGRPEHELFQRIALHLGAFELGYDYEHLGRNFLDRRNSKEEFVARRDLHGLDVRARWRGLSLQVKVMNLTDERASDVAKFPLPGRTIFTTIGYQL